MMPWLPVGPNYRTHNVESELKDQGSILSFYQRLLALRHEDPALREGEYVPLNEDDPNVLCYLRTYKDEAVLVVLNMSSRKQTTTLNLAAQGFPGGQAKTVVTTLSGHPEQLSLSTIALDPFAVYIGKITK